MSFKYIYDNSASLTVRGLNRPLKKVDQSKTFMRNYGENIVVCQTCVLFLFTNFKMLHSFLILFFFNPKNMELSESDN